MLNKHTQLVKIGKSKSPIFREKTLQGQEPEVILISFWEAPPETERLLHKEFSHKRQRGEWFDLTFKELQQLKGIMQRFDKSNGS